jgi:hypothetical protein
LTPTLQKSKNPKKLLSPPVTTKEDTMPSKEQKKPNILVVFGDDIGSFNIFSALDKMQQAQNEA